MDFSLPFSPVSLSECLDFIPTLIEKIKDSAEYPDTLEPNFGEQLSKKFSEDIVIETKLQVYLLYSRDDSTSLLGVLWLEKTTPYYGCITYCCFEKGHEEDMVQWSFQQNMFMDAILELVYLQNVTPYLTALRKLPLKENKRQRMGCWLSENTALLNPTEHPFSIRRLSKYDCAQSGELSFLAHQVSKDYEFYSEMNCLERRIKLEERVFDSLYGPVLSELSFKLYLGEILLGYCLCVGISCWGYEQIPWVFDVAVHPDAMGKGVGRFMMQYLLEKATALEQPIVGLAVTLNNASALHLYEALGFTISDSFSEFIQVPESLS